MKPRDRVTCVLVLICACARGPHGQPHVNSRVRGPELRRVSSTELVDTGRAPLGAYTSFFTRSATGITYIGDQQYKRVVVFASNGRRMADIGQAGDGPGEFQIPAALGLIHHDSVLAVNDAGRRTMELFDATAGTFLRMFPLPVEWIGQDWVTGPDDIVFATQMADSLIGRWRTAGDSIQRFGASPRMLVQHPGLYLSHGQTNVAPAGSGFAVFVPTEPGIRIVDRNGVPQGLVVLPVARRAGEPSDLAVRQAKLARDRRYDVIGSSADGLHRLTGGELVVIHLDVDRLGDADHGRFGNFRLYASLVSADDQRACVDAPVPIQTDVAPIPAFVGDTMFVLARSVSADNGVRDAVIGFLVTDAGCEWQSTGGIQPATMH
ncbi:MAG: hypothetical protein ACREL5_06060 [Gemmatimonadales bacterium]